MILILFGLDVPGLGRNEYSIQYRSSLTIGTSTAYRP